MNGKRLKRAVSLLMAVLLTIFCLVSCGELNPAHAGRPADTGADTTTGPADSGEDTGEYSVSLFLDGELYIPREPINVQWSNGDSYYTAPIGEDGVARVGGLDGDYTVTLSAAPDGYVYNPNVHRATRNDRHTVIDLYSVTAVKKGKGTGLYDCFLLEDTGVYQVELKSAEDVVYYQFTPRRNGIYSVESWVDVSANEINPKIDVYSGSSQFKVFNYTLDDGGAVGEYTKNFLYDGIQLTEESVGQVYTFAIKATQVDGKYPIKVNFAVQLNGEFPSEDYEAPLIIPKEDFRQTPEYDRSKYEFVGMEINIGGSMVFETTPVEGQRPIVDIGPDGYYHLFNEVTGLYDGPTVYAKITEPCRFLDDAFTAMEYRGNKALTVSAGTENYKLFIEGFDSLVTPRGAPATTYFCSNTCRGCHGDDEALCISGRQCCTVSSGCEKCDENCRLCPDEAYGQAGYADYCNSDGVYAVTPELKDFLQKFSVSQSLFFDGNGHVETHPTINVDADDEDQWLFACGYYKEIE